MRTLVWSIGINYGWATERVGGSTSSDHTPYGCCYIGRQDNGLWAGGYSLEGGLNYVNFPGEYPLEEIKPLLETTIALLSEEL